MDNDSVVEQIVRSLSFEVEAVPQENIIQLTTSTKSAPLNVRIRVRKKENAGFQHGILSLPKPNRPDNIPERVRLVSSDQTIMSFDVVMEADFQKSKKNLKRKNFMSIFKPTICLGAQPDEDNYMYLPNKTYEAEISQESTSKSEGALTKFTLTKNMDIGKVTLQEKNKDIFGKCKPGGCLDPPFGEDKHPYSLAQDIDQKSTQEEVTKRTEKNAKHSSENIVRMSSILSKKLFNRKKKNYNDTLGKDVIKKESKDEYILDLYQAGRSIPTIAISNSIMTYPPTLNSSEQLQIQEEKQRGSRIYSDTSKNSVNEHSGSYFIMSKKRKDELKNSNTVNIEDDFNLGDSNVIKLKTMPANKNTIAQNQVMDEDKKKNTLRTRKSATDLEDADIFLIQSSDSKDIKISIQKLINNLASITTELEKDIEYTESQKQEDYIFLKQEPIIPIPIGKKPELHEHSTNIKAETTKTNNKPSGKNIEHTESEKQEGSYFTNKNSGTELHIIPSDKDKGQKEPQEQKKATLADNDSETKNVLFKKDKDHEELKKPEDSTFTKPKRSELNNIPSIRDKETKHHLQQKDSTYIKRENLKSNNILSEKYIGQKKTLEQELEKQKYSTFLKTERSEAIIVPIILPSETQEESKKEQKQEDITSIKTERSKSNNIILETDVIFKEPQKQVDPTFEKTDLVKLYNSSLVNHEVPMDVPNQDLIFQKSSNIALKNQEILDEPKPDEDFDDLQKSTNAKHSELGDESTTRLPTSIDRDTPLEIILNENDDYKHLWENRKSYLESEVIYSTDKDELNKQKKILLEDRVKESFHHSLNASFSKSKDSDSIKTENESYFIQDKVKILAPNESETQNVLNASSQTKEYGSLIERTVSTHSTLNLIDEIHSVTSQKPEPILFIKLESEKIRDDNITFSHQATHLEQTTELIQAKDLEKFEEPLKITIGNGGDVHNKINKFVKNKDTTQPRKKYMDQREYKQIKDANETSKKLELNENRGEQQIQSLSPIIDGIVIASHNADQNKVNDKHIKKTMFDNNFKADSKNSLKLELNSSQAAAKEATPSFDNFEKQVPNKNNLSQIQTPVTTAARHKTRPIVVNLAIQRYVDDNNQIIIKSFDANNLPKRYPHDSVKITKRYLETDDKIHIPIDSENDLYLQIKKNKERDINEVDNFNKDPDITRKNIITENHEDELDQIKRNMIIDDIRKTLVAVYEQELLPLRNTIAELKDYMETLTAKHLLMKGHMFIRKPRSNKLVPLYRKCSCLKK